MVPLLLFLTSFVLCLGTSTRTTFSSARSPIVCWRVPSWPKIWPSNTSTWPTHPSGFTSPVRTPSVSFGTWRHWLKVSSTFSPSSSFSASLNKVLRATWWRPVPFSLSKDHFLLRCKRLLISTIRFCLFKCHTASCVGGLSDSPRNLGVSQFTNKSIMWNSPSKVNKTLPDVSLLYVSLPIWESTWQYLWRLLFIERIILVRSFSLFSLFFIFLLVVFTLQFELGAVSFLPVALIYYLPHMQPTLLHNYCQRFRPVDVEFTVAASVPSSAFGPSMFRSR